MLIDILVGADKRIGNGSLGGDDGTPEDLGSHGLPFCLDGNGQWRLGTDT